MTMTADPNVTSLPSRSAAELGLASLLLSGFLAVLALLALQINLQMYLGPKAWAHGDLCRIRDVAIVGAIVIPGLTLAGIAFAVRSLVLARRHAQSSALGWAGLAMGLFCLCLWIGVFVDLFSVLDLLVRSAPRNILEQLHQAVPAIRGR